MNNQDVIVSVDFDSEVIWRKRPLFREDIVAALTKLKECGADGIAWRLTCLGQAHYRSAVLPSPFFDEADVLYWQRWAKQHSPGMRGWMESAMQRREWNSWIRATLDRMDPPEVAGQISRELGLKFLLWIDLFDGWFPGSYDPVLRANPERCWTDRSGKKFLRGVASYAVPENAQRILEVVREINSYKPDGLYLCLSCHSLHVPEHQDVLAADGFGYEKPVLERFHARHNRDPDHNPGDNALLDEIRGEFMTELFRKVRAGLEPSAALYLPLQMHASVVKTSPYFDGPVALSYFQDYQRWLDDGLAQGLVIGDFEHIFHWVSHWKIKGLSNSHENMTPIDYLETLLPNVRWRQCPHYLFSGWMNGTEISRRLEKMAAAHKCYPASGGWLHELCSIEQTNDWGMLRQYTAEFMPKKI